MSTLKQQPSTLSPGDEAIAKARAKKLESRRIGWEWNSRLLFISAGILLLLGGLSVASYYFNSSRAADTFLSRADESAKEGRYDQQAKWLSRYSMILRGDLQAIYDSAMAADRWADESPLDRRGAAADQARKSLASAIARLGNEDAEKANQLRRRYIVRLLDSRVRGFEVVNQVITLDEEPGESDSLRWMALGLVSQVSRSTYTDQSRNVESNATDWKSISKQKVGEVLIKAIDANPNDVDLIDILIGLAANPEHFEETPAEEPDVSLQQRVKKRLDSLADRHDSRIRIMRYRFMNLIGKSDEAASELLSFAKDTSKRIQSNNDEDFEELKSTGVKQYPPVIWDYELLAVSADLLATENLEQAQEYYNVLTNSLPQGVSLAQIETVFLRSGLLAESQKQFDKAEEIWTRGLEVIDGPNLKLIAATTQLQVSRTLDDGQMTDEEIAKCDELLERFQEKIDQEATKLINASKSKMPSDVRIALQRMVEAARWRKMMLEGVLESQTDVPWVAIVKFSELLATPADVQRSERVMAAKSLAALYQQQGLWDMAANTLEEAVQLAPKDIELRVLAAQAWNKSGNRLKAIEQWRLTAKSESLALRVANTEAMFVYQLRLPPAQRDFSGVRAEIESALRDINSRIPELDNEAAQQLSKLQELVQVIRVSLPPSGVQADVYLGSEEFANAVARLAEQSVENDVIQAFAARRLAAIGNIALAEKAAKRLEALVGKESAVLCRTRAAMEVENGNYTDAAKMLQDFAERDWDKYEPLLREASSIAMKANNASMAYQILTRCPDDSLSLLSIYQLVQVINQLPDDASELAVTTRAELVETWQQKLKEREGEAGSFWRYLEASQLIEELYIDRLTIEPSNARLNKAAELVRALLLRRPRWGQAISLEGWVSAIKGDSDVAIRQLRRGIAAGDTRLATRNILIEQLIKEERFAEADQEILQVERETDFVFDEYGARRARIAQLEGDINRGLELAKAEVEKRPNDFIAHVRLAMTAIRATKDLDSDEAKQKLFTEAEKAIENAKSNVEQEQLSIRSASLNLKIAKGKESDIRNEIQQIEKCSLPEHDRLILMSHGLTKLGDIKEALPLLVKADELRPTSTIQLALAEIYNQLGQQKKRIDSLRLAMERNPANDSLRKQLARVLVTQNSEDISWPELSKLLDTGDRYQSSNQYLYGLLLYVHGDKAQKENAIELFRKLIKEDNSYSDDAARTLAAALQTNIDFSGLSDGQDLPTEVEEIRSLYENLCQKIDVTPTDLYQYANFLLRLGREDDHPVVKRLLNNLRQAKGGTLEELEIRLRFNSKTNGEDIPQLIEEWASVARSKDSISENEIMALAASSLVNREFFDEGFQWFEEGYQNDPKMLGVYVVALNRNDRIQKALDVCADHYRKLGDVDSAILLAETMLNNKGRSFVTNEHCLLIEDAVKKFGDNIGLLESTATWRMETNDYEGAIELYQIIDSVEPNRIRTLNNLAMAYSEIPGEAASGLGPIQRAIELSGEHPELLDTYGVVLMQMEKFADAEKIFRQALTNNPSEPRYQFHLILTLLGQGQKSDAKVAWNNLDRKLLNATALTHRERGLLEELESEFE